MQLGPSMGPKSRNPPADRRFATGPPKTAAPQEDQRRRGDNPPWRSDSQQRDPVQHVVSLPWIIYGVGALLGLLRQSGVDLVSAGALVGHLT